MILGQGISPTSASCIDKDLNATISGGTLIASDVCVLLTIDEVVVVLLHPCDLITIRVYLIACTIRMPFMYSLCTRRVVYLSYMTTFTLIDMVMWVGRGVWGQGFAEVCAVIALNRLCRCISTTKFDRVKVCTTYTNSSIFLSYRKSRVR